MRPPVAAPQTVQRVEVVWSELPESNGFELCALELQDDDNAKIVKRSELIIDVGIKKYEHNEFELQSPLHVESGQYIGLLNTAGNPLCVGLHNKSSGAGYFAAEGWGSDQIDKVTLSGQTNVGGLCCRVPTHGSSGNIGHFFAKKSAPKVGLKSKTYIAPHALPGSAVVSAVILQWAAKPKSVEHDLVVVSMRGDQLTILPGRRPFEVDPGIKIGEDCLIQINPPLEVPSVNEMDVELCREDKGTKWGFSIVPPRTKDLASFRDDFGKYAAYCKRVPEGVAPASIVLHEVEAGSIASTKLFPGDSISAIDGINVEGIEYTRLQAMLAEACTLKLRLTAKSRSLHIGVINDAGDDLNLSWVASNEKEPSFTMITDTVRTAPDIRAAVGGSAIKFTSRNDGMARFSVHLRPGKLCSFKLVRESEATKWGLEFDESGAVLKVHANSVAKGMIIPSDVPINIDDRPNADLNRWVTQNRLDHKFDEDTRTEVSLTVVRSASVSKDLDGKVVKLDPVALEKGLRIGIGSVVKLPQGSKGSSDGLAPNEKGTVVSIDHSVNTIKVKASSSGNTGWYKMFSSPGVPRLQVVEEARKATTGWTTLCSAHSGAQCTACQEMERRARELNVAGAGALVSGVPVHLLQNFKTEVRVDADTLHQYVSGGVRITRAIGAMSPDTSSANVPAKHLDAEHLDALKQYGGASGSRSTYDPKTGLVRCAVGAEITSIPAVSLFVGAAKTSFGNVGNRVIGDRGQRQAAISTLAPDATEWAIATDWSAKLVCSRDGHWLAVVSADSGCQVYDMAVLGDAAPPGFKLTRGRPVFPTLSIVIPNLFSNEPLYCGFDVHATYNADGSRLILHSKTLRAVQVIPLQEAAAISAASSIKFTATGKAQSSASASPTSDISGIDEIVIPDGPYRGNWVKCRVAGKGSQAGTFNIYVLPTSDFDSACGFSGKTVPNVSLKHLRASASSSAAADTVAAAAKEFLKKTSAVAPESWFTSDRVGHCLVHPEAELTRLQSYIREVPSDGNDHDGDLPFSQACHKCSRLIMPLEPRWQCSHKCSTWIEVGSWVTLAPGFPSVSGLKEGRIYQVDRTTLTTAVVVLPSRVRSGAVLRRQLVIARCPHACLCMTCKELTDFPSDVGFNVVLPPQDATTMIVHSGGENDPCPLHINLYDIGGDKPVLRTRHELFEAAATAQLEFYPARPAVIGAKIHRSGVQEFNIVRLFPQWRPTVAEQGARITLNPNSSELEPQYRGQRAGVLRVLDAVEVQVILDDGQKTIIPSEEIGEATATHAAVACVGPGGVSLTGKLEGVGKLCKDRTGTRVATAKELAGLWSINILEEVDDEDEQIISFRATDADLTGIHQAKPQVIWSNDGEMLVTIESSDSENRVNLFRASGTYPLLSTYSFKEESIVVRQVTGHPYFAVWSNKAGTGTVHIIDATALTKLGPTPIIGPDSLERMVQYDVGLARNMHHVKALFQQLPELCNQSISLQTNKQLELTPQQSRGEEASTFVARGKQMVHGVYKDAVERVRKVTGGQSDKDNLPERKSLPPTTLLGYAAKQGHVAAVEVMLAAITGPFQFPVIEGYTAFRSAVETGVTTQPFLDRIVEAKKNSDLRVGGAGAAGVAYLEDYPASPNGHVFAAELCKLASTRPGQVAQFLIRYGLTPAGSIVLGAQQQSIKAKSGSATWGSDEIAPRGFWERVYKEKRVFKKGAMVAVPYVIDIPGFSSLSLPNWDDPETPIDQPSDKIRTSLLHRFVKFANDQNSSLLFRPEITRALVHYKWRSYARSYFAREAILFAVFLVLTSAFAVLVVDVDEYDHNNTISFADGDPGTEGDPRDRADTGREILGGIVAFLLFLFLIFYIYGEIREMQYWGTAYASQVTNWLDITMYSLVAAGIGLFASGHPFCEPVVGVATLSCYAKVLWYLQGFRRTSPLIRMILQIAQDIS